MIFHTFMTRVGMTHLCKMHATDFMKRATHRLVLMKLLTPKTKYTGSGNGRAEWINSQPHRVLTRPFSHLCVQQNRTNFHDSYYKVVNRTRINYSSSSLEENFMAKFSEEIDLDALREQKIQEFKKSGVFVNVHDIVRDILAEKCDEALANLSPEESKKVKVLQLEHDFLFSEGYLIPSAEEMTSENWLQALNLPSKARRLKYYLFCQKRKFRKENDKLKKQQRKEERARLRETEGKPKPMDMNRIFMRTYDSTIKRWGNHRLAASMQHGIPLVLDMDYQGHMSSREVKNTAEQLHDLYTLNRSDDQLPFHLHYTSCPTSNPIYRFTLIHQGEDPHFMATVSHQSYMDLFEKERLVYLSPNGKQVLREFDPSAVYIIGAFNDKNHQKPVSYARAKEQGIQCVRLPLDQHLEWSLGSKALTLNQVMLILTAIKNKKSWEEALQAVPARKLKYRKDLGKDL